MGETIVHSTEDAAGGVVADLAGTVGGLTEKAANVASDVADHAEQITNVQGDTDWIKERLERLESTVATAPGEVLTEIQATISRLAGTVESTAAELSTLRQQSTPTGSEPITEAPPPQTNEAAQNELRGPFAGARRLLHRLL